MNLFIFFRFNIVILLCIFCLICSGQQQDSTATRVLSSAENLSDSIVIALSLCERFNGVEKSQSDSLLKYAKFVIEKAQDNDLLLEAKEFYALAYKFRDSTIFFNAIYELRDMYLEESRVVKAAEAVFELSDWHAYKMNLESVRSYADEALEILDNIPSSKRSATALEGHIVKHKLEGD